MAVSAWHRNVLFWSYLASLAGLSASAGAESVRFVRSDAPSDGDGLSWATAYREVFEALQEASSDPSITQVWIAAGTYLPGPGSGNRGDTFVLVPDVVLYGGFDGSETSLDQRDPIANVTTLSGDFDGNDGPNFTNIANNARHVVTATNFTQTAGLDGLTIRGGNADFNPNQLLGGGGMFIQSASVTLANCRFVANSAGIDQPTIGGFGGAIYNLGGILTATACLFSGNRGDNGGAIGLRDLNGSTLTAQFTDCQFTANAAEHQTGGAVWTGVAPFDTVERTLTFTDCTFADNLAQYGGAIIEQNIKHVRLENCTFVNNQALVVGGAMWHNQSGGPDQEPIVITRCQFIGNQSADQGGAIFITAADSLITNCLFQGNVCTEGVGGAVRSGPQFGTSFGAGDLELYNCVFAGNSAVSVGSVAALRNPLARVVNCTVSGNFASQVTGGLFSDALSLEVTNSIFWQNQLNQAMTQTAQLLPVATFGAFAINESCVQGLTGSLGGVGNIADDPLFVDANGPDGVSGTADDDLHVLPDSPVVDAGDASALPMDRADLDGDGDIAEPLPLDLDDNARVSAADIDMGAYESPIDVPSAGDIDGNGDVDARDFGLLQVCFAGAAVPPAGACPPGVNASVDGDADVDLIDLSILAANLTGPQ